MTGDDIKTILKEEEAKDTFVICDNCGTTKISHELESNLCRDFVPLATFAQLKAAWEFVDEIAEGMVVPSLVQEEARRIRGEKGAGK